jgi:hypothetical protein
MTIMNTAAPRTRVFARDLNVGDMIVVNDNLATILTVTTITTRSAGVSVSIVAISTADDVLLLDPMNRVTRAI